MATIIGLKERQEALNEINATIRTVANINKFLENENPSSTYNIRFSDAEGKKQSADFSATKEEISSLLLKFKAEKREYVKYLAQEYTLGLDPEDKVILGIE